MTLLDTSTSKLMAVPKSTLLFNKPTQKSFKLN